MMGTTKGAMARDLSEASFQVVRRHLAEKTSTILFK
jgi:hypothetical protein